MVDDGGELGGEAFAQPLAINAKITSETSRVWFFIKHSIRIDYIAVTLVRPEMFPRNTVL